MLRSAGAALHFDPARRLDPAWRLILVAALLSAGKVLLYTSGTTLFLARQGVEALPALYLVLAAVATLASLGLAAVIDRVPVESLLPGLALVVAIGVGGLLLSGGLRWPLMPGAILIAAHVYDIVTDIVFWVLAATLFDNLRLRRLTPRFYLAIAAGGSVAGILAERLLGQLDAALLLWPVIGLCGLAVLALGRVPRSEIATGAAETRAGEIEQGDGLGLMRPGELGRFVVGHPFALLLAMNSLLLTAVYSLTEYVAYAVYAESFSEEAALGRFLALLFAALQVAEFAVLWFGAQRIVERAGPVLRNLLFPLTSLLCLVALLLQPRLGWAIVAHVNTEAVSNGVFEPVNATNYGALPMAVHGRARTLADGIFYPIGMAVAGLMLALLPSTDTVFRATVLALLAALFFVGINLVVARSYLPTLLRQLRHGLAGRPLRRLPRRLPPCDAVRLAELLTSRRTADRRLALDLLEAAPPAASLAALLPELLATAPRLAQADWVRLASLLASLEPATLATALARAVEEKVPDSVELLATAHLLADRPLPSLPMPAPPGSLLAALRALAGGLETDRVAGATEDIALRGRLAAILRRAPLTVLQRLAQQPALLADDTVRSAALDALSRLLPGEALGSLEPFIEDLRHSPLPAHRAAALRYMGRKLDTLPQDPTLEQRSATDRVSPLALVSTGTRTAAAEAATRDRFHARLVLAWPALSDPSRTVRAAAIDVLLPDAERTIARITARGQLREPALPTDRARGLIELLAAIGDRPAHRLLRQLIAHLAAGAERDAILLQRLADGDDPALAPLRAAVLDRAHGLAALLFDGLGALGDAERASKLREALREVDTRLRAGTIDGLISLKHGLLARRFVPLLEQLHLPSTMPVRAVPQPVAPAELLALLAASGDRWLRAAVELVRKRATADELPPPVAGSEVATIGRTAMLRRPAATVTARTDAATLEIMLRLKRFELFAELPFDVLEAVLHLIEERQVAAGMIVQRAGGPLLHAWLVDTGSIVAEWSGGRRELLGPDACIGETALVDPTVVAPELSARATSRLFRLHRVAFQDLAREHTVLTESLCRLLARNLNLQRSGDFAPRGASSPEATLEASHAAAATAGLSSRG